MSVRDELPEVPASVAASLVIVIASSTVYVLFVRASLVELLMTWTWIFTIVLSVLVVYLLYRFVLATEEIARSL